MFVKNYIERAELMIACRNLFSGSFVSLISFLHKNHVGSCVINSGSDKNRPGNQIESPNGRTGLNTFTPPQQSITMPGYISKGARRLPLVVFSGNAGAGKGRGSRSQEYRSSQKMSLSSYFFSNSWIGPFILKPIGMISVSMENSVS